MLKRIRRHQNGDEGLALISVIGASVILTGLVVTTLAYALQSERFGRTDQDRQAALAAAEAGVDHYLDKLNTNNAYFLGLDCSNTALQGPTTQANSCGWNSGTERGWVPVPGRANDADFHYAADVTTTVATGLITLSSTGRVNGEERTVVVSLRRGSFLDYLYFSDKETLDPELQRKGYCDEYLYNGRPNDCTFIRWVSVDNLLGPLHTNDSLVIDGDPTFNGEVTTAWADPSGRNWYEFGSGSDPSFLQNAGNRPRVAAKLTLPPSNVQIKAETDPALTANPGCRYRGATRIRLLPGSSAKGNGRMEVYSPRTPSSSLNPGCPLNGVGNLPANGVVYVEPVPSSQSCSSTRPFVTDGLGHGYPQSGDNGNGPSYSCRDANVFVSGTLDGQLTIASEHNVFVVGDTRYESGTCTTCTDVLGLIGTQYVWVYHPINSSGGDLQLPGGGFLNDVKIDAAIASNNHSFQVQNYQFGSPRSGFLNVTGAIIQKFRGPVGTGSATAVSTGYAKNYVYDQRLKVLSPPFFIAPADTAWKVNSFAEQ